MLEAANLASLAKAVRATAHLMDYVISNTTSALLHVTAIPLALGALRETVQHPPPPARLSTEEASVTVLKVMDQCTRQIFLVDMGAEILVIPTSYSGLLCANPSSTLCAADRSAIFTYGRVSGKLHLTPHLFEACLFFNDMHHHLLRADILCEPHLLVDVHGIQLLFPRLVTSILCTRSSSTNSLALCLMSSDPYAR